MGLHGVQLLRLTVEIEGLSTLFVASVAGFLVFEWLLRGMPFGVVLKHFLIFQRVLGAKKQAFFGTVWPIDWMVCMIFPKLSSTDLLGVG